MAEALAGLAVAASVVAVIQIADRVVGICKYYLGHVEDAPADLRAILVELSSIKSLFENLEFLSGCKQGVSKGMAALGGRDGPVKGCRAAVKALEDLFPSNIIEQTNTKRSKKRKLKATLAALAWPLREKKAKLLMEEIGRYRSAISLALITDSAHDIKTILSTTFEIRNELSEAQRNEVFQWLAHTDPSLLHHRACDQYEPETGKWMLRTAEWTGWLDPLDNDHRCIWIHGIPGAGKTVLMSHLVKTARVFREHKKDMKRGLVFYYCYFGNKQDETTPFLKWMIQQLCRQAKNVPAYVHWLFKRGGLPNTGELLQGLEDTLAYFETVHVFIDALDESQDRHHLLQTLASIATEARLRKIRLLTTSREYIDIERIMTAFSKEVSMSNPFLEEDIRRHVGSLLRSNRKFQAWSPSLLGEVEQIVPTKAKGMFRWAVCQIDILRRLKPDKIVIAQALDNLPKTLFETYDQILLQIPEVDRLFVLHVLAWLSFDTELHERSGLSCLILIDLGLRSITKQDRTYSRACYDLDDLQELCGCLLRVSTEAAPEDDQPMTLARLAHYTVQEYLNVSSMTAGVLEMYPSTELCMNDRLLHFLLREAQALDPNEVHIDDLPNRWTRKDYYDRTEIYLMVSAIISNFEWEDRICESEDIWPLALDLWNPRKPHYILLENMLRLITYGNGHQFGLPDAVTWISKPDTFDAIHLWNVLFRSLGEPQSSALGQKALETIDSSFWSKTNVTFQVDFWPKFVVESPAPILFEGSYLEIFSQIEGFPGSLVGQLLDRSAGTYDPSRILVLASTNSHLEIMKRMLQEGADTDGQDFRTTPLQIATRVRNSTSVKLLLEAGADPNKSGGQGDSAWGKSTYQDELKDLAGLSPLYIYRNIPLYEFEGMDETVNKEIESLLLEYGAKEFREDWAVYE